MMGHFGELTAQKYGFSREDQDEFCHRERAAGAGRHDGAFEAEIAPVTVKSRKGETVADKDEEPGRCDIERIPTMRPAFAKDGTVTAATSSSISDGAAHCCL
jgi:acetyl-CoA C-acetyltransferase